MYKTMNKGDWGTKRHAKKINHSVVVGDSSKLTPEPLWEEEEGPDPC